LAYAASDFKVSLYQWQGNGGGGGGRTPFVVNMTSYLVTFIRIRQNLYFIYPI